MLMLELECERALYAAEQDWVREVLGRMESGELDWPAHRQADLIERLEE